MIEERNLSREVALASIRGQIEILERRNRTEGGCPEVQWFVYVQHGMMNFCRHHAVMNAFTHLAVPEPRSSPTWPHRASWNDS